MKEGKRRMMTVVFGLVAALTMIGLTGVGVAAEKFPSKEISIIVPYAAGGPIDLATRVLAEYFQKDIGVPVVVENRAEAAGIEGVLYVYKAKPDGHTLLANIFPRNAMTEIFYNPPFKIMNMTYIAAYQTQDVLFAVRADSPYKTLKDLVAASKTKFITCSTPGQGSRSDMNVMLLKKVVGLNIDAVPFKGGGPAMLALLGGNVDSNTNDDLTILRQKGKVRALATFATRRSKRFPDVPTFKELGFDVPVLSSVQGPTGPPNMPKDIYQKLSDTFAKTIKNPEFMDKIDKLGPEPIYLPGPEFHAEAEVCFKVVEKYKDMFMEGEKK
jgi:tripartite-type tricarboxylate transporter receptor subunit TctC